MSPGSAAASPLLVHQTGALLLLAVGSVAIAWLPLALLHYVYRKRRRRLRERELQHRLNQQHRARQPPPPPNAQHVEEGENHREKDRNATANWLSRLFLFANRDTASSSSSSSRNASSRSSSLASNSHSSLAQHFSEVALASTLAIPSILLDLARSLDGGLLLAALFLILLPQLRLTFDSFMTAHVTHPGSQSKLFKTSLFPQALTSANESLTIGNETTLKASALIHPSSPTAPSYLSPVPLVELILCLAFFALHFAEEFAQLCLRYRKYFWACNSALVYASSSGTCELSSLDYRISRTKRFLIDCSRKTTPTASIATSSSRASPSSHVSSPSSVASSSTSQPNPSELSVNQQQSLKQFVVTESSGGSGHRPPETNGDSQRPKEETIGAETDSVCDNHNMDSLIQVPGGQMTFPQPEYGPNSLLSSSSSSYLPSYYWHPQAPTNAGEASGQTAHQPDYHAPYYHPSSSSPPESMPYLEPPHHQPKGEHHHHSDCVYYHHHYCCPCGGGGGGHYEPGPSGGTGHSKAAAPQSESGSGQGASSPVFTKMFLPYTTLATSTPALYLCEGILVAIQPSASMLWLMLCIVLTHKLVTGLLVSFELHEKTTGRQRQLPTPTAILFTGLPLVGYLGVLLLNGYSALRSKDRAVASQEESSSSSASSPSSSSIETAAIRVVLFAVASATLLHLVLLIIQRNLAQYQPQFQLRKHKSAPSSSAPSQSTTVTPAKVRQMPGLAISKSGSLSLASNKPSSSSSSSVGQTVGPQSSTEPQQQHPSQQPQVSYDPEIVTNPPRYGVLHHFTMYTGFIAVLMATAFLNMKSAQ